MIAVNWTSRRKAVKKEGEGFKDCLDVGARKSSRPFLHRGMDTNQWYVARLSLIHRYEYQEALTEFQSHDEHETNFMLLYMLLGSGILRINRPNIAGVFSQIEVFVKVVIKNGISHPRLLFIVFSMPRFPQQAACFMTDTSSQLELRWMNAAKRLWRQ